MNIQRLIDILPEVICVSGSQDVNIKSVVGDSRKVTKGSLYVAIPGMDVDGHDYISEACRNGAIAIIGEKDIDLGDKTYIRVKNSRKALAISSAWIYQFPAEKLKIIGVTGTNGKTTLTYLIKAILDNVGASTGVIGTIGNIINSTVLPADYTTPEAPELHGLFSKMVDSKAKYAAMEVSSHSLKLHRVYGVIFELGIFTNITQDHLDFHKTFDDYFQSKKRLFEQSKKAIINTDDINGRRLLSLIKIPAISYGINSQADVKASNIRLTREGVFYELFYKDKNYPVYYDVPGLFSVYNSLAAIAVGIVLELPLDTVIKTLAKVKGVPGRFEPIKKGQDFTVIVDYSHTPDSLENAIRTARGFCDGKIYTVFGCGGDRDRKKRPQMGRIASELSDLAIITSDNPRSEDPEAIIEDIVRGIQGNNYIKIVDRRQAIREAIEKARKGDVVLIAGKGHEDYQILKDKTIPFDDRKVAEEFLSNGGQ